MDTKQIVAKLCSIFMSGAGHEFKSVTVLYFLIASRIRFPFKCIMWSEGKLYVKYVTMRFWFCLPQMRSSFPRRTLTWMRWTRQSGNWRHSRGELIPIPLSHEATASTVVSAATLTLKLKRKFPIPKRNGYQNNRYIPWHTFSYGPWYVWCGVVNSLCSAEQYNSKKKQVPK